MDDAASAGDGTVIAGDALSSLDRRHALVQGRRGLQLLHHLRTRAGGPTCVGLGGICGTGSLGGGICCCAPPGCPIIGLPIGIPPAGGGPMFPGGGLPIIGLA